MGNNTDINNDFDYTIVLDAGYTGLDLMDSDQDSEETESTAEDNGKAAIDSLYDEYEKMCLKEPSVIDKDDAYPHSYQWRMIDKYDPVKVEVVKAAINEGKRIAETDAYLIYMAEVGSRKFKPESWD